MDEEFIQKISDLELDLEGIVLNPTSICIEGLKIKTGPFYIQRFWYDFHDDTPTFGVTYTETSVKNGKEIFIFKPIRLGTPTSIVAIWVDHLKLLLKEIAKESNGNITEKYITDTSDSIREEFKEMMNHE